RQPVPVQQLADASSLRPVEPAKLGRVARDDGQLDPVESQVRHVRQRHLDRQRRHAPGAVSKKHHSSPPCPGPDTLFRGVCALKCAWTVWAKSRTPSMLGKSMNQSMKWLIPRARYSSMRAMTSSGVPTSQVSVGSVGSTPPTALPALPRLAACSS